MSASRNALTLAELTVNSPIMSVCIHVYALQGQTLLFPGHHQHCPLGALVLHTILNPLCGRSLVMQPTSRLLVAGQGNKAAATTNNISTDGKAQSNKTASVTAASSYAREADKENVRTAIPTRLMQQQQQQNGAASAGSASGSASSEPTMSQLLAQTPQSRSVAESAAATSSNATNIGLASWRKGQGFKAWESELLRSQDVRRKADVAQLCESSLEVSRVTGGD